MHRKLKFRYHTGGRTEIYLVDDLICANAEWRVNEDNILRINKIINRLYYLAYSKEQDRKEEAKRVEQQEKERVDKLCEELYGGERFTYMHTISKNGKHRKTVLPPTHE